MIDFDLTEEHRLLEQTVREWAAREVAPHIAEPDRAHRFDPRRLPQIYEGTREIHALMQADSLLGYRADKPTRCEWPRFQAQAALA